MPGRPAARLGDMTAHGSPLAGSPGSPNVLIGKRPAWRGITAAQAAQLAQTIAEGAQNIAEASARVTATAGTPAAGAAVVDFNRTVADAAASAASMITSFAPADIHICPMVKLVVPDGAGVVINGSQTVLINALAACRVGDTIQETTSINTIIAGEPTVLIGG
ncbi:PAAR domain-containing protein [Phormidium tenue FACHB-886]|nr:PAAR domain-containing protein [Phormidium tenue FACHB-886]